MFKLLRKGIDENLEGQTIFVYKWFGLSLVLHLLVAWCSVGFYHYDEHFQILDFAGFKVGHIPGYSLPWEYKYQIRSTFQPWIAVCLLKFLMYFRIDDPFLAANILRLCSAFLGWLSIIYTAVATSYYFTQARLKKWLIVLCSILPVLLFIHARFSSESWSGSLAFLGVSLILLEINPKDKAVDNRRWLIFIIAGFMFGLSYLCRVQSIFLYPGFFLWLFFIGKVPIRKILYIVIGTLIAVGVGVLLDRWFYGNWVNTTYNYFFTNIVQGRAAKFGTFPWWWYIKALLNYGFWPFQFLFLILTCIAIVSYRKNPLIWICIPFLLAHFLVSHKELRFIFPLIDLIPILWIMGLQTLINLPPLNRIFEYKIIKIAIKTLYVLYFIYAFTIIVELCMKPPMPNLYAMEYIYKHFNRPMDVIINDMALNKMINGRLKLYYYRRAQTRYIYIQNPDSVKILMNNHHRQTLMLLSDKGFDCGSFCSQVKLQVIPLYYQLPTWFKYIDINHWTSRTSFWRVYEVKP